MRGRGREIGGKPFTPLGSLTKEETGGKVKELTGETVRDLREIARKSDYSLDDVVEMFTGQLINRLEGESYD